MSLVLVEHAVKNAWCVPTQDQQAVFTLARQTAGAGARGVYRRHAYVLPLPNKTDTFDIHMVGQVHPALVALFPRLNQWLRVDEACMRNHALIDLYTTNGVMHPRTRAWYIVTEERNILFAVAHSKIPIAYASEKIHLRVHRGLYHVRAGLSGYAQGVRVKAASIATSQQAQEFMADYDLEVSKGGGFSFWCNGFYVTTPRVADIVGKYVEWLADRSVDRVVDLKISELATFRSELDQRIKYLLHAPGSVLSDVQFEDDIDMHLVGQSGTGVHYHKNRSDSLRNVTHCDYSTPVDQVVAFLQAWPKMLEAQTAQLRLIIRRGGLQRTLPNIHHRIRELYRLDEAQRAKAMTGVASVVPVWRAAELERSAYVRMLGVRYAQITPALVAQAYGFNATLKVLADPFMKVTPGERLTAPLAYRDGSTVFEYNEQGLLEKFSYHAGLTYTVSDKGFYVEWVSGRCGLDIEERVDEDLFALESDVDWRLYVASRDQDAQSRVWVDVSRDPTYWTMVSGKLKWLCGATHHTLARSNRRAMLKTHLLPMTQGYAAFNLTNLQTEEGERLERRMNIPMGELDVWLNRKSLIEGLDYRVDFPRLWIHNKSYLDPNKVEQEVIVRMKGHPDADLGRRHRIESGFVRNDILSVNRRFDVRQGMCFKTTVGGRVFAESELKFNEDSGAFILSSAHNGKPYALHDLVNPLVKWTQVDTYDMRLASREVDASVGAYLSQSLTQPEPTTVNPQSGYHRVYSAFMSKIIHDLVSGVLVVDFLTKQYSDMQIENALRDYLPMLDTDPLGPNAVIDANYVKIDPHCKHNAIRVSVRQYAFLNRVAKRFGAGRLELSTHLSLG